jgi:hypothetical protein
VLPGGFINSSSREGNGDSCMISWYSLYYLHIYRVICDEDNTATPIDSSVIMGSGGGAVD